MDNLLIDIIPTKPEDIIILGESLREADLLEILSVGLPLRKVLWRTYKASIFTKSAFINGQLAAVWGVGGTTLGQCVRPWLLTTSICDSISPLRFCRIYQQEVLEMIKLYPKLVNYVDARYTKAVRLLENIGFTLSGPEPIGKNKAMFRKFEMRAA